ncbi:hypothetical protein GCM10027275_33790 [Rhabdobacter roseus]|uniref:Uncharacterized protein n=1 Tax=Rhabdobacter roseus TaxID=1655419 RepID=A0A840TYX8_9BACT|nr:hypothetical protein [Rhabdobacter roseus]MBB5285398.1 hypothetical protein [Rhabdobacter roseus]
MQIQLFKGQFGSREAAELITRLIHVKIKYHEEKIQKDSAEEDIKMREARIRELQKDLYEVRRYIEQQGGYLSLQSDIQLV